MLPSGVTDMKILKKLNLLDWCIIAAVVLVLAVACIKVFDVNETENLSIENTEEYMSCTAVIRKVSEYTAKYVHVGDNFYEEATGALMGTVTSVAVEPYTEYEILPDGSGAACEIPGSCNVIVTLSCPVLDKENGYYFSGVVEMKANSQYDFYSKYIKTVLKIQDFE